MYIEGYCDFVLYVNVNLSLTNILLLGDL